MRWSLFMRKWFRCAPLRPQSPQLRVEALEDRRVPAGVGVFDPALGNWYLHDGAAGGAPTVAPFQYGGRDWIPVMGDWDGDGVKTVGAYYPATGTWYLRN